MKHARCRLEASEQAAASARRTPTAAAAATCCAPMRLRLATKERHLHDVKRMRLKFRRAAAAAAEAANLFLFWSRHHLLLRLCAKADCPKKLPP